MRSNTLHAQLLSARVATLAKMRPESKDKSQPATAFRAAKTRLPLMWLLRPPTQDHVTSIFDVLVAVCAACMTAAAVALSPISLEPQKYAASCIDTLNRVLFGIRRPIH